MADYSVDPEAVSAMSTSVAHCSDAVPKSSLPDAGDCGSSVVADAMADFAEWRRVTWNQARASLTGLSSTAKAAAEAYAAADRNVQTGASNR